MYFMYAYIFLSLIYIYIFNAIQAYGLYIISRVKCRSVKNSRLVALKNASLPLFYLFKFFKVHVLLYYRRSISPPSI